MKRLVVAATRACAVLALVVTGVAIGLGTPAAEASTPRGTWARITETFGAPWAITAGPDGLIWFGSLRNGHAPFGQGPTEATSIWRVTTDGRYANPLGEDLQLSEMVTGPDGAVWFTSIGRDAIGRMTPTGGLTWYQDATVSDPEGIVVGPDGALWFANGGNSSLGRITTAGVITNQPVAFPHVGTLAFAPDGTIWVGIGWRYFPSDVAGVGIGHVLANGSVVTFPLPGSYNGARSIVAGPDGQMWFVNDDALSRIAADGTITPVGLGYWVDGLVVGADGNVWATGTPAWDPLDISTYKTGSISRITPAGVATTFVEPGYGPAGIVNGPDGNLWVANAGVVFRPSLGTTPPSVGRVDPVTGVTTTFSPNNVADPRAIALGADGNVWYAAGTTGGVARVKPLPGQERTGVMSIYPGLDDTRGIAAGPDGNLWSTGTVPGSPGTGAIARTTTSGVTTVFADPLLTSRPLLITAGPDGNLWFTMASGASIGRITPAGVVTRFDVASIHTDTATGGDIVAGPDGNVWFANTASLGRITPAGVVSTFAPAGAFAPAQIGFDANGALWYVDPTNHKVGRRGTAGGFLSYALDAGIATVVDLTPASNGQSLWFTIQGYPGSLGSIGRVTTGGAVTIYSTVYPIYTFQPRGIVVGPDGDLWYTDGYGVAKTGSGVALATTTSIAVDKPAPVVNENLTVTVTVQTTPPYTPKPTGTVALLDNGSPVATLPLVNGVASWTTSYPATGSHSFTATYPTSTDFVGSTSSAVGVTVVNGPVPTTTTLSSSTPSSSAGQPVTLTATTTAVPPATGGPAATVTFKDGATVIGTAQSSGGVATFTTSSLAVGSHSLTATNAGGANFQPSTSAPITQTVGVSATTASISTTPGSSVFRQPVDITVTVAAVPPGAGGPSANVTIYDGAAVLAVVPMSGGTAHHVTTALSAGSHSLKAVFGGAPNYAASTSGTITHVVSKADTTTSVGSSANPQAAGSPVTFAATVAAVAPSSGAPAASVVFKDGATTLATVPLTAGSASFTTSALGVGSHGITVTFAGGANFNGSTSPVLTQTVT